MPGSRRVVPLFVDETQIGHLRELLDQGEAWVGRKRWVRWLDEGRSTDTMPIGDMTRDDRIAACSWLRQQRHVLHDVIHGGSAPVGWIEQQPLYKGLAEAL
jgi:hypothetical protein